MAGPFMGRWRLGAWLLFGCFVFTLLYAAALKPPPGRPLAGVHTAAGSALAGVVVEGAGTPTDKPLAGGHPTATSALAAMLAPGAGKPSDATASEWYRHFCRDGPKLTSYWSGLRPREFAYWIPLTIAGIVATTVVTAQCLSRLMLVDMTDKPEALKARAHQTTLVASTPLIIAVCKGIVIAYPSIYAQVAVFVACFEVYAFFQFMLLLFGYLGEDEESIAQTSARITPSKVWAVPPLCCCWAPFYACMARRVPSKSDLKLVRRLMYQFMALGPSLAVLEVAVDLSEGYHRLVSRLEVCSLLLGMYGLFALLRWTHDIIDPVRTHQKFWALKGVLIGNTAVYRVAVSSFAGGDVHVGDSCYPAGMMAAVRAGTVTALLCVPFAFLGARAFTADDLTGTPGEKGAGAGE